MIESTIKTIFQALFESFGHQGWWPLISHKGNNPTKSGSVNGYHPENYEFPKTTNQKEPICLGAILTQYLSFFIDLGVFNI